jgi:hypothetical protein
MEIMHLSSNTTFFTYDISLQITCTSRTLWLEYISAAFDGILDAVLGDYFCDKSQIAVLLILTYT